MPTQPTHIQCHSDHMDIQAIRLMALTTVDIVIRCGKEIDGAQDAHVLVPVSVSGECKHCCVSTKEAFHFDGVELCCLPFVH